MEGDVGGAKSVRQHEDTGRAITDFYRIFASDTNPPYLLSLLLTGDPAMAERCFVAGLEDSAKPNAAFKEWARSWARRAVIQNAIRMLRPWPLGSADSGHMKPAGAVQVPTDRREIAAVIALPVFERFVFVISVLEGYSVQNCSLLLGCTRADVVAARTRALESLGASQEANQNSLRLNRTEPVEADPEVGGELKSFFLLAASA